MNYIKLSTENIGKIAKRAVETIQKGDIVLAPFDTVYGFIADPKNNQALEKIFKLKERDRDKTIGVAVSSLSDIKNLAQIHNEEFVQSRIPGRYTFILNSKQKVLSKYCYQDLTIGIRVPANQLILEIAKLFGPVAQTSANKSGQSNCFSLDDIKEQFSAAQLDSISLVIDGGTVESNTASEIWDLTQKTPVRIER